MPIRFKIALKKILSVLYYSLRLIMFAIVASPVIGIIAFLCFTLVDIPIEVIKRYFL
jgi:hypothetical protein